MAVGVVIGAAFGGVTALTKDLIYTSDCRACRQTRFFGNQLLCGRFHQRCGVVSPHGGGDLFLRGYPGKRPGLADAKGTGTYRPHHEEVP